MEGKNEFKGNFFNTLMCSKLKKLLKTSKPDLIIGTHPFPMIALSTLKKHSDLYSCCESSSFTESIHKYYKN